MAIKVALFGFRAQSTVVAQERVRAMAHASAAMRAGGVRMVAQQRLGNNARQAGCYIREGINRGGAISLAEHAVSPTLIQAMGRWSSEAFKIYVRKHPSLPSFWLGQSLSFYSLFLSQLLH